MRCVGSLAPIFWGRTRFLWYKWMHNRFWGQVITKNDVKPIFTFLAQPQIWEIESQDGENQRGIYFFDYLTPKTIALYFRHINISPPPKYGGQTPKNALDINKHVDLAKPNLTVYLSGVDFSVTFFLGWCIANSGQHLRIRQCDQYGGKILCANSTSNVQKCQNGVGAIFIMHK